MAISIVRYKILQLEVEKHHFNLIIDPNINKFIFQAQIFTKTALKF
jgi:hypothetical protein